MKHRKTKNDIAQMEARFNSVCDALQYYTLEELKQIYLNNKMSSTDSDALKETITMKLYI